MASRQQLEDALISAHEAGDSEAAQLIANEIKQSAVPTSRASDPSLYSKTDALKNSALSIGRDVARSVGMAGRTMATAGASIPLAAADAGIGVRNALTGSNYDSASKMWNESFDPSIRPQTFGEKAQDFAGQVMFGSKIPAPSAGSRLGGLAGDELPAFAKNMRPSVKDLTLQASQKAGYVVPPTTTNPSATNKVLEGMAGKLTTAQLASAKNQETTNKLAAKAIGIGEDVQLSPAALEAVRANAGEVYAKIAKTGNVIPDAEFANAIRKLPASVADDAALTGANRIDSMLNSESSTASAGEVLQKIKELRFQAQRNLSPMAAQNPESAALGRAQKKAADSLESLLMRHLDKIGAKGLADEFADARTLIAKTHSVEKALNGATGNVSATKLGAQLAKGKPLSGELKIAAQFSQAFPKAAREFNESLPGISPLDFYGAGGVSAGTKQPWWLMYPLIRQGVRQGLLSPLGQRLATPMQTDIPPELLMGGAAGLLSP